MTVIEALVVTLGLDIKDFDKNDRRVNDALTKFMANADKKTKAFESSGKRAVETFSSLKTEIIGAVAAFAGFKGLQDFVVGTTDSQAALGRLAENTKTSASALKAWDIVAQEVGAHAGDAYGVFNNINAQLAQASVTGTSPLLVMMRRLGVEGLTAQSGIQDVLLKFSARLHQLPRNQAQYAANEAGMGPLFQTLMLSGDELKKRLTEALATLPANFDQSTKAAEALQAKLVLIKSRFEGIRDGIYADLAPAFFALFDGVDKWMKKIDWNAVAAWVGNLVPSIESLIDSIEGLNAASGGWLKILGELALAWWALDAAMDANPIGAVIALTAALVALWNDYQTWQKGGKSLINWGQWKTEIELAKEAIGGLIGILDRLDHAVKASANWVADKAGAFAAQKAAEIYQGKTANAKREQGSATDRMWTSLAYAGGYDPRTGQKLSQADQAAAQAASDAQDALDQAQPTPSAPTAQGGDPSRADLTVDVLLDRVRNAESAGDPNAVSSKGAIGAYQMLPATAAQYGLHGADLNDPVKERAAASAYIHDLLTEFHGDLRAAMAAYNWGPGNVEKFGTNHLPAETTAYLAKLGLGPGSTLGGTAASGAGAKGTTYDHSSQDTQVGPIYITMPPGSDLNAAAAQLKKSLSTVNVPQALNTGAE